MPDAKLVLGLDHQAYVLGDIHIMAITKAATRKGLSELFHDTLKDIYFAEKNILSTQPEMATAALSQDLQAAFEKHHGETQEHVARLEEIFEIVDKKPQAKTCAAIMGITDEGSALLEEYTAPALDAELLAIAQAVEHREISRCGTMRISTAEPGMDEAVTLLDLTLGEERPTDQARRFGRKRRGTGARLAMIGTITRSPSPTPQSGRLPGSSHHDLPNMEKLFNRMAGAVAHATGRPWAFALCLSAVVIWAACGPLFGYSETWQLVINTGTTIVTFLMVFLIQNTQNVTARPFRQSSMS